MNFKKYLLTSGLVISLFSNSYLGAMQYAIPVAEMQKYGGVQVHVQLEGKLKPVAACIENNLERYQQFEQSNPKIAKVALKGARITTKAMLGATAGGRILGGPAGIIPGFIVGAGKGIVDEIPWSAIVNESIDKLASRIKKWDSTLNDHEAKVIVAGIYTTISSAAKFKTHSKEIFESVNLGITRPRTLVKNTVNDLVNTLTSYKPSSKHLKDRSFKQPGSLDQPTKSSTTSSSTDKQPATSSSTSSSSSDKQKPATETQDDDNDNEICEFLTSTVQDCVKGELEESEALMKLEKSSDHDAAVKQIQKRLETNNANLNYEASRAIFADTCQGISSILSIGGNPKTAAKITGVGHAGVKLMDSCHALATGTTKAAGSASTVFASGTALTPVVPYVGIACAVASLICTLAQDDDDPLSKQIQEMYQALSQQIQKTYEALSGQIEKVYTHMIERFDGLEGKVDLLQYDMVRGFSGLSQQLQNFSASSLYSLEHISRDLQVLHEINSKVDALLLRPFIQSCSAIDLFQSRFDTLKSMEKEEAIRHYLALENSILGIDPTYEYINGFVCSDFSPTTMNRILTSACPEAILGYLANYIKSGLNFLANSSASSSSSSSPSSSSSSSSPSSSSSSSNSSSSITIKGDMTIKGNIVAGKEPMLEDLPDYESMKDINAQNLPNLKVFLLGLERYLDLRQNTTGISYDNNGEVLQRIAQVGDNALRFIESVRNNKALFDHLIANYKSNYEKVLALFNQALEKRSNDLLDAIHSNAVNINRERNSKDLEWLIKNKNHFKVSIALSKEILLSNADTTILCATVQPNKYNIPFSIKEIAKFIPKEAIIAERLGLGIIEPQLWLYTHMNAIEKYSESTPNCPNCYVLINYGTPLTMLDPLIAFRKEDKTLFVFGLSSFSANSDDWTGVKPSNAGYCEKYIPIKDVGQSIIDDFKKDGFNPAPKEWPSLSTLIDERLVKLRKEAIAMLLNPTTELGTQYKQAVDALEASYNLLKAFGTIAGFGSEEMQTLMNKDLLDNHHKQYLANASITTNAIPETQEGAITTISSAISRSAASNPMDNAFARPLYIMLAKLGHFAQVYHEIVRQRQDEIHQNKPTEKEVVQLQKIDNLEKKLYDLTKLLQQLLDQKK